jgi:hypothetical protein
LTRVLHSPMSPLREWGDSLMRERGERDKRLGVGRHRTRPNVGADLKAVRTGVGAALRTLHSEVLCEDVPNKMAELLSRLDQPTER